MFLGGVNLAVGANNLSTNFSGLIQDGGVSGGTGGSLTKTGNGKLTLSTANTYTGGTTVTNGTLLVRNKTGSATGTGAVQVNAGTLGWRWNHLRPGDNRHGQWRGRYSCSSWGNEEASYLHHAKRHHLQRRFYLHLYPQGLKVTNRGRTKWSPPE